jgi:predicted transposase YbfD/YdcC
MVVETMRLAHQHAPLPSDYRVSLASLGRSATTCVTLLRQQWAMEHKRPWSRDVTCKADRGRIRKAQAPEKGAAVRPSALNLRRQAHSRRMRLSQKRPLGGLDEHYLLTVLSRATSDAITLGFYCKNHRESATTGFRLSTAEHRRPLMDKPPSANGVTLLVSSSCVACGGISAMP